MEKKKMYKRSLAFLLVLILLSSICGHLITTNGANVKVESIVFDARGAMMESELYYPHGTTDEDALPAVIVTHGAGVNGGNMKNFATELARRGFVVLNVTAYGAGISEFPANDEIGTGVENYNARATPGGLFDAINFLRTFDFIDKTRIGIMGHSQGSRRISYAAALDCGYLSLNDTMINVLHDTFDVAISETDLSRDADTIAEETLNQDQLAYYYFLRDENKAFAETRVKSALVVGGDAELISPMKTVNVGGHEVERNCQTNLGLVIGSFDRYTAYPGSETTLASYHTDTPISLDTWYELNDVEESSRSIGSFFTDSILENEELKAAIDNRTARFVTMPDETHGRNMLSNASTSAAVKFFEQTLSYNCGELGTASGIPYNDMVFIWREICSLIAMICMLLAIVPFTALLLNTPYFESCMAGNSKCSGIDKKKYWIFNLLMIPVGFFAIFKTNSVFAPGLPYIEALPITFNWWMAFLYLLYMAGFAAVLLIIFYLMDRKNHRFGALNLRMKLKTVMKTVMLALVVLVSAYILMSILLYLFAEDFKFWTVEFTKIKVEQWWIVIKFAVLFLPELLLLSAITNYTIRDDFPVWKEDLICVVFGCLGVWLCWLIDYIALHTTGVATCNWNSSYGMLILVPITTLLNRKLYRVSGSIWLGSILNGLLIGWTMVCINGYNTFFPQSVLSNFFNL